MAATIGIKIANGEFYSILEENSDVKKRLVLTTVHNNQQSVQIDLYKSNAKTMVDALYIGSLVVENIKPKPKGEPSIELTITSTTEGNITAEAVYLDTSVRGDHQTLTVSLKSLEDVNLDADIPDFELEHNEPPPTGLYDKATSVRVVEEEKRGFPWLIVICVALLLTAIGLAIWFFAFRDKGGEAVSRPPIAQESQASTPKPAEPAPPAPAPEPPPPVIQAPAAAPASPAASAQPRRNRPPAPVSSYNVPSVIPKDGAPYRIRWGDTLWDIAEAFYRDPWQYPRIARFNNIRNPDLIISGTTIRVPPRN